jgi:hypothetical protein
VSSEWPIPDGLDPPGEQLELPWDGEAPESPAVVETVVHRVTWGRDSWACACGAGRAIGPGTYHGRARAAAVLHITAVRRRIAARS